MALKNNASRAMAILAMVALLAGHAIAQYKIGGSESAGGGNHGADYKPNTPIPMVTNKGGLYPTPSPPDWDALANSPPSQSPPPSPSSPPPSQSPAPSSPPPSPKPEGDKKSGKKKNKKRGTVQKREMISNYTPFETPKTSDNGGKHENAKVGTGKSVKKGNGKGRRLF